MILYQLLWKILRPILWLLMKFNLKISGFLRKRLTQNFDDISCGDYIWLHCSSVGEINLSEKFIKRLLEEREEKILLTLFTDTGLEIAKSKFKNEKRVLIYYFPLDNKKEIKKILEKINLKILFIVETEIWINLILECRKKCEKIIFINGRISDKSFGKYKKLKGNLEKLFENVDKFFMQSQLDKERIIQLGADVKKVENIGNLKFDIEFEKYSQEERDRLLEKINGKDREIFVVGSSRSGEYDEILKGYKKLKNTILVLVPRHLQRIPDVIEKLEEYKLSFELFSKIEGNLDREVQVILVDKMGILRYFYSIADYVFVGGTLVNIGGHSLLEPLFFGKTPIFGPYLQNVKDISKELLQRELGYKITNSEELVKVINILAREQSSKDKDIRKLFEENRNSIDKIIESIREK